MAIKGFEGLLQAPIVVKWDDAVNPVESEIFLRLNYAGVSSLWFLELILDLQTKRGMSEIPYFQGARLT